MSDYTGFAKQIPEQILERVEKHMYDHMALFKPDSYIVGRQMLSEDFHLIIPSAPPPDTYVNGRLHRFPSGKLIVFNPGDTILAVGEGVKRQYLSLLIKPEWMNRIAEQMDHSGPVRFSSLLNPRSSELLQAISAFDREMRRPDSFPMLLDSICVQITALLLRSFRTNAGNNPTGDNSLAASIDRSMEYMNEFYDANITIEDICREVNLSPFHFIRSFREKTGISPHQYLLKVRIRNAETMLRSGRYSVAETAALCGFISLSHFSSTFKKGTGHSPAEYKRRHFRFDGRGPKTRG